MTRVALIADDATYRLFLEQLLQVSGRYAVDGSFQSAEAALATLPGASAQIALVDLHLPGIASPVAVGRLRLLCPGLRSVMLTHDDSNDALFSALTAGASGYLLKDEPPEKILAALDELLAGGAPMSRLIASRIVQSFARPAPAAASEEVTPRERQILDELVRGCTDKEIAAGLGISTPIVKNHLYGIYEKLAVRSRTEAVVK